MALRHLSELSDDVVHAIASLPAAGEKYVQEGDVVLVYGRSSGVESLLLSHAGLKQFTVVVVDAAPLYEGRQLLWRLQQRRVQTLYVLLSAVCRGPPG